MTTIQTLPDTYLPPRTPHLAPALEQWCDAHRVRALQTPVPTRKTEQWKYSSRYLNLDAALAPSLPGGRKSGPALAVDGYHLVLHNGLPVPEASDYPDLDGIQVCRFADLDDAEAETLVTQLDRSLDLPNLPFAHLNGARLGDGVLIRLSEGCVLDKPLFIICETDASQPGSHYPRLLLDAGKHSQITLVEEHILTGDASAFVASVSELILGEGAQVTYVRLGMEGESAAHVAVTGAVLASTAHLDSHCIGFGGRLRRHDLQVRLEGKGAQCRLNGVTLTQNSQHYDNHTVIEHIAPHCTSEETYRMIAAGASHAVFNGRIHIHRDAQKSAAAMSNKNLLLSREAEIDTKPELEIYADDVKCAHGTTIGQLDPEALFYLVSRGIDRREATTLLSMAFINTLVEQIPLDAVREAVQERLARFIEQTTE